MIWTKPLFLDFFRGCLLGRFLVGFWISGRCVMFHTLTPQPKFFDLWIPGACTTSCRFSKISHRNHLMPPLCCNVFSGGGALFGLGPVVPAQKLLASTKKLVIPSIPSTTSITLALVIFIICLLLVAAFIIPAVIITIALGIASCCPTENSITSQKKKTHPIAMDRAPASPSFV